MILKGEYESGGFGKAGCALLGIGVFWEGFTCIHMGAMMGGFWTSGFSLVPLLMMAFYVPFHAVGLGMIGFPIYKALGQRKVKDLIVSLDCDQVGLGQELTVTVRFTPRRSLLLNKLVLKLEGKEIAKERVGTSTRTHTDVFHTRGETVGEGRALQADLPVDFAFGLEIPSDTMCSFVTKNNRVTWTLSLNLDLPGVDFSDTYPLTVLPQRLEASR